MGFFPDVGTTLGEQELKFQVIMKYGQETQEVQKEKLNALNEVLNELIEQGILSSFEFGGNLNYKSKKEIPLSIGGAAPAPATGGDQLKTLSELVLALAASSDDATVADLAKAYKSKYL
jgi:hypothetical protein